MPYFGVPIRNGLPIGLGSVAGFGVQQFSPADLFSAGEQGAWYDPSDLTTLFTDSAGTTPVTAVEQFVGLMLDKSKGLVLGSELVTGAFVNGGAFPWPNFSASGTGFAASVTGAFNIYQVANPNGVSIVSGRWYKVVINIMQSTDDAVSVAFQSVSTGGGVSQSTIFTLGPTTASTVTCYLQATSTATAYLQFSQQGTTITFNVASVSVRELPGNHATSTGTKRPKLAARYNLLQRTEEFDNGYWAKRGLNAFGSGSVANTTATLDPLGGNTADYIQESTANSVHGVDNNGITLPAAVFSYAVYLKAAQRSWAYVRLAAIAGQGAYFDLANGVVGTVESGITASITNAGNGWWRCRVSITTTAGLWYPFAGAAAGDNQGTYTGDGTSGIYIWGADLRPASQATGLIGPTYQRVVDAATYDTVGFLPYLQFDGIDDSMSTGSIDFTATDKMTVWAGVRKLAAGLGMIAEISTAVASNNGSFYIAADNGTNDYGVSLRGTAQATYQPATYAAPITNVISAAFDIGAAAIADENKPRVNGVLEQDNPTGTNAGTGNFGNYPLFIGARNNASLYFNGWMYSLTVRGAQSSASEISAMESWVAGKTGVSL